MPIRPIEDEDIAAVIDLWTACGLIRPWNDPNADIARVRAAAQSELFVLDDGDGIAASVMVGDDGHRGWLYYLAVADNLRHQGLGRKIVHHAEEWLRGQGAAKVELMIRADNEQAKGFYDAADYHTEPRIVMARWLDSEAARKADRGVDELEVTITYLQMLQRPKTAPVHAPSVGQPIALLHAEKPNVPFYRYLYNTVGEPWLWYERREMSDEALATIIVDPLVEIYVLYLGGSPAGYAELDRREERQIELAYFGLMPEFTGRGIGKWFLDCAIDTAWRHEPEQLWIHTCTLDHPAALRLYQRAGFEPYKQETERVSDPRVTGLIRPTISGMSRLLLKM